MNLNLFPKAGLWSGFSPKVLLVMKLTVFLTIITLTQVSATVYSQRITLEASNTQLETILEKIKAQSGYELFYDAEDIRKAGRINVHVTDVSVEDALRSEEHTSELQSLMRISYAVFCLKKKKQYTKINTNTKLY